MKKQYFTLAIKFNGKLKGQRVDKTQVAYIPHDIPLRETILEDDNGHYSKDSKFIHTVVKNWFNESGVKLSRTELYLNFTLTDDHLGADMKTSYPCDDLTHSFYLNLGDI